LLCFRLGCSSGQEESSSGIDVTEAVAVEEEEKDKKRVGIETASWEA